MKKYSSLFLCSIVLLFSLQELSSQTSFSAQLVKQNFTGPAGLFAGDIDADGDTDLLAASGEYGVFLCENRDLGAEWVITPIDTYLGSSLTVWMDDLDGDGDQDIVSGGWDSNQVVWYENLSDQGLWKKSVIKSNYARPHEVRTADVDGDGHPDILVAGATANQVSVFFNSQGDASKWTEQTVAQNFMGSRSVDAADLDHDGDLDLVGASLNGNEITLWRNDGGTPINWSTVAISNQFTGSHRVQLVDMDGDGWIDILGTAYSISTIRWWKNPGNISGDWQGYNVDDELMGAVIGTACDFDQDGDMDVVGTGQPGNVVTYYERLSTGQNVWKKKVIDDQFGGAWPLCIGDFNGDQNPDFVVGGNSANKIVWYQNIQEGRLNRKIEINEQEASAGFFIPPGSGRSVPLVIAMPYCGDEFAYSRLRDMLIPLTDSRRCLIMVPDLALVGGSGLTFSAESVDCLIDYACSRFSADPDSVYLAGLGCSGEAVIRYAYEQPAAILGALPFNPELSQEIVQLGSLFPDIPVYLSSGSAHPDRLKHENLIDAIHEQHGKAWLDQMEDVGSDVLVFDLSERLLSGMEYIDTVKGFSSYHSQISYEQQLVVFPNPASENLFVHLPDQFDSGILELVDLRGRVVYTTAIIQEQKFQIPLDQLPISKGMYFLMLSDRHQRYVMPFVYSSGFN